MGTDRNSPGTGPPLPLPSAATGLDQDITRVGKPVGCNTQTNK